MMQRTNWRARSRLAAAVVSRDALVVAGGYVDGVIGGRRRASSFIVHVHIYVSARGIGRAGRGRLRRRRSRGARRLARAAAQAGARRGRSVAAARRSPMASSCT